MSKQAQEIPQGQPQEVIGGGLAGGVVKQLIAREELVSTEKKENNQLLFFNGNGAWARIVSSVNTLTEEETLGLATGEKTIKDVVGSKNLAFNNVIMGGTLKQGESLGGGVSETTHNPINIDQDGYITAGDIKTSAYHKYSGLGFRPTPGITSVSVKSKGTYGTLREAEVAVTVWDLEDLEMMQALYLRPGFTILLEWGHSLQLDSETKSVRKEIEFYRKFLRDRLKTETIERDLYEISQNSDFNYDSMFGYVSNFSWSFREDGGYDCTIKIISKGTILESLAVTFDPSNVYPPSQFSKWSEDKRKKEKQSIFHKLFCEIDKLQATEGEGNLTQLVTNYGENIADTALAVYDVVTGNTGSAAQRVEDVFNRTVESVDLALDTVFGDLDDLATQASQAQTLEGRIAMENEAFVAKLTKLNNGGSTTYNGRVYTWTSESGIADLEEEELVNHLNREFGMYGFKFVQGQLNIDGTDNIDTAGDSLTAFVASDPSKRLYIESDNTFARDDKAETLRLIDFIQENAVLPDNELTPEQLQQRQIQQQQQQQINDDLANAQAAFGDQIAPEGEVENIFTNDSFNPRTGKHFQEHLNKFLAFKLKGIEYKDTGFWDNDDINEYWIPLYCLLDVYNNYVSTIDATQESQKGSKTKGRKLTQFYTGFQDENINTVKYDKKLKYLTNEFHFSIDPIKCILPKIPTATKLVDTEGNVLKWPNDKESYPMGVIWKNGFHQNVGKALSTGLMRGESDDILNILLSVEYLQTELSKIVDASKDTDQNEGNDMVSFMRTVLRDMTEAMGGINDLDLFYDEGDDLFYIVDRKVTPALRNFIPTLALTGTKSTISNLNIDSKISSNIGNMVSIAAQGTGGHTKDSIGPLLEWNRGLLDRHIIHKSQKNTVDGEEVTEKREKPEDERLKKWIEDFYDYWEEFNGEKFADDGDYNKEAVNNIKNYHKEFCQKWVVEKRMHDEESPIPAPGVIPIELSFTTMGIAGLKIGQTFRIEEGILPQNYATNFGYIITGLSHNIADSKWTTDVKTQFYSLVPPTPEEIAYFKEKFGAGTDQYNPPVGQGSSPTAGGTSAPVTVDVVDGEDPAPIVNGSRFGGSRPTDTPVFKRFGINLRNSTKSNILRLVDQGSLIEIGDANTNPANFSPYMGSAKKLDGKYYLQATAGRAFLQWFNAMKSAGINFQITSAVRFGSSTGGGAHGYGIAVDIGTLYRLVNGSTSPSINKNARIQNPIYKQIAELGANYGWYNPWRLSDSSGTMDELWHFEYWGPA